MDMEVAADIKQNAQYVAVFVLLANVAAATPVAVLQNYANAYATAFAVNLSAVVISNRQ